MIRFSLCLIALAAVALIPVGPASGGAPEATAAKACGTVKLTLGKSIVRGRGVRCADARRFVKAMLSRDCGTTRDCNFSRFSFRGYSCEQRQSATLIKNSCTKGRKAISELHS